MCSSIHLRHDVRRLTKHFGVLDHVAYLWDGSSTLVGGSPVPVVEWNAHGQPTLRIARFGFQMRNGVLPMTSFRSESINLAKPSRAFLEGRCVVPADLFFGRTATKDGVGTPSYGLRDDGVLALAAMLRPEAHGLAVTILTVPARAPVCGTAGRMPAIVNAEDIETWLDDTTQPDAALRLLRPAAPAPLVIRGY